MLILTLPAPARPDREWTEADDRNLRFLIAAGYADSRIARILDRSVEDVRLRAGLMADHPMPAPSSEALEVPHG